MKANDHLFKFGLHETIKFVTYTSWSCHLEREDLKKKPTTFVKEKFGPEFATGKIIQITSFFCALDTE